MQKTKHNTDPYTFVHDPYSAVEEYYKLKRLLERNDDNLTLADFKDEDIDIENFNFDELREKLNEIKLKKRYSFSVMASLIGVSNITLSNFYRGKRNILKDNIPKFLRFIKGEQ